MQSGFGKPGSPARENIGPRLCRAAFALCNGEGPVRQIMFSREVLKP
jgi:hypothetical protein